MTTESALALGRLAGLLGLLFALLHHVGGLLGLLLGDLLLLDGRGIFIAEMDVAQDEVVKDQAIFTQFLLQLSQ